MNLLLLCRLLSFVAMLIGGSMAFSLPWALPVCGGQWQYEQGGFVGLLVSMVICFAVGGLLWWLGRKSKGKQLFRKEAMAVVGLSWILAALLGALPYLLSGASCAKDRKMDAVDAVFEAQSGFTTTGATVLTELEDYDLVPKCILFWRSSTHFLGGLGIIVLFVAILGQGSAGKALMRAEMPGPGQAGQQARMQHTAWVLFLIYVVLNGILTVLLQLQGLSLFDSLCHAFGTMATGGFSTYNLSVGHFATVPGLNAPLIEMTIAAFMVLAGTNFMLLYFLAVGKPKRMFGNVEWRTYMAVMVIVTLLVVGFGLYNHDFGSHSGMQATEKLAQQTAPEDGAALGTAFRYSIFQVVSIMTTTGFCTDDFNLWCSFSLGILLMLMFVGGCAGSTGGGLKVIRHILFTKILRLEVEHAFRPSVVRPLRLGGEPVEDPGMRTNILVYFGLILLISTCSWLFTITVEPDSTWTDYGHETEQKLIDGAGCVAATLNNIDPGLGVIGATKSYTNFTWPSKILFILLMMIGRLEIFVILVLFVPGFWRTQ
ncbi:MAG: TrkH family potassium uptake protein [Thermoguttaceae bacterium]